MANAFSSSGIAARRPRRARAAAAASFLAALLSFPGCTAQTQPPPAEQAFVARNEVDLRSELGPGAPVVATLRLGARVEVVGRRRSFVRVRSEAGAEGWTKDAELVSSEIKEMAERLRQYTAEYPGQGVVRAFDTLNVHLEPYRWSPTLYQLEENEGAELLRHRLVERLPHAPRPGQRAPEPIGHDDWYLVRLPTGRTGWLLSSMVYSGIPDEVAQYAEGRRIVSYFALGEVEDKARGETKKIWLWTQISRNKQGHDFDRFRVFRWSPRRHAYQTILVGRGLVGYLPVRVLPQLESKRGSGVGFELTIEKNDERVVRRYVLIGQRVYRVSEEPAPPPSPPIKVEPPPPPLPPPPNVVERFLEWWKQRV